VTAPASGTTNPRLPTIFLSYSHRDEGWKDRLLAHLGIAAEEGLLAVSNDRQIGAGADWLQKIQEAIEAARVAVFLISADFLTSRFIRGTEVPQFLKRRVTTGLQIFPVIVRSCDWQVVPWLSPLQARPRDGKPLAGFRGDRIDAELATIAKEIREMLRSGAAPASMLVPEAPLSRPPQPTSSISTTQPKTMMANLKTILLSSTAKDLQPHRDAVFEAILRMAGYHPVRSEDSPPSDGTAEEASRALVAGADVVVGLVGHLHGSRPRRSELSYTEIEYEEAKKTGKPLLMFLAAPDFSVPSNLRETQKAWQRQQRFREQVSGERAVNFFREPDKLAVQVVAALQRLETGGTRRAGEPEGRILLPKNRARLAREFSVEVALSAIPSAHHVWIAVQVGDLFWPKEPVVPARDQNWIGKLKEGGPSGKRLSLALLMVEASGHKQTTNWRDAGAISGEYDGLRKDSGELNAEWLDVVEGLVLD
jgi:Domain of unknown function (DUF4062)/TIR domain